MLYGYKGTHKYRTRYVSKPKMALRYSSSYVQNPGVKRDTIIIYPDNFRTQPRIPRKKKKNKTSSYPPLESNLH